MINKYFFNSMKIENENSKFKTIIDLTSNYHFVKVTLIITVFRKLVVS